MEKRTTWILSGVLLLAIILLFLLPGKGERRYSTNPEDWVITTPTGISIDVEEASQGTAEITTINQQFRTAEVSTAFSYEIVWDGDFRENPYTEAGKTIVEITEKFSDDGVPQIMLMEQPDLQVLIFVDEDWKQELKATHIVWGKDFERQRPYLFKPIGKGIYMDKVEDDPARFPLGLDDIAYGGIAVGKVSKEDIAQGNLDIRAVFLR